MGLFLLSDVFSSHSFLPSPSTQAQCKSAPFPLHPVDPPRPPRPLCLLTSSPSFTKPSVRCRWPSSSLGMTMEEGGGER